MVKAKPRQKLSPRSQPAWILKWLAALECSPSFHLAHDYRQGLITLEEFERQVVRADLVLQTYDDFGYVPEMNFIDWVNNKSKRSLYSWGVNSPRVTKLTHLNKGDPGETSRVFERVDDFMNKTRKDMAYPPTLMMAIPTNLSKSKILKMVAQELDRYKELPKRAPKPVKLVRPKYPVIPNRLRIEPFNMARRIVWTKCVQPDWPLWKVGLMWNLNKLAVNEILRMDDKQASIEDAGKSLAPKFNAADPKRILNVLASRMINRYYFIAENAARGKFPCTDPIIDDEGKKVKASYDFHDMNLRLRGNVHVRLFGRIV